MRSYSNRIKVFIAIIIAVVIIVFVLYAAFTYFFTPPPGNLAELTDKGKKCFTNSVGMQLCYVPKGSFIMGSNTGDSDEKPVHEVDIAKPFLIGKYEVTQKEYSEIMGNNPTVFEKGDNKPVTDINWYDAVEFCQKLTLVEHKDGVLAKTLVYKLPTESEWEYAASGGGVEKFKFSGSNSIDKVAWYRDNSENEKHEIGLKKPNNLGIYDMSGNVWEWCRDWYGKYSSSKKEINPVGPETGRSKVVRGGRYYGAAVNCRITNRYAKIPDYKINYIGFRVILVSDKN